MAQLFQPTNITPDTRGAFGNGVVNILGQSITVSWQVNGNTPMTSFQLDFYNMSGTLLYSTGELTNNCPFYGADPDGETQLFSYSLNTLPMITAGMESGQQYQMKITQFWGANSVKQASPSVFLTRMFPEFVVTNQNGTPVNGSTITSRDLTATANHWNSEDSGSLMWIRWQLFSIADGSYLKDSGNLYGSVEPSFSYDSLLPGQYVLILTCETEFGMPYRVDATFTVSYSQWSTGIKVEASRACNGESAVLVRWPRFLAIPVTADISTVTDNGNEIIFKNADSYLTWNTVNGSSMSLLGPWSIIWSGSVTALSGKLFTVQTANATYEAGVGMSSGFGMVYLTITQSGQPPQFAFYPIEWEEGDFMCCITPSLVYWKCMADKGSALYPRDSLYPAETLYPGGLGGTTTAIVTRNMPTDIPQTAITSVTLHGPASIYGFEIIDHTVEQQEAGQYLSGGKMLGYNVDSLFFIGPKGSNQTYNAGNVSSVPSSYDTIDVYRQTGSGTALDYVGTENPTDYSNSLLDYAARSQQGPYTYYVYLSTPQYINVPSISNEVNPCFWNWTVLSCTENSDGSYSVQASYNFGKNLQSGSIQNNNQPGIFQNFTPYPTVMIAPQNYQSGTLQSLIGVVSDGEYSDTIDLRDAIYNLSLTTNTLFLKNRKGDLLRIRPSGEISMETMDNTRAQALTVSFPWVEVGDASGVAIYRLGGEP